MPKLELDQIRLVQNIKKRSELVSRFLDEQCSPENPLELTDYLMTAGGVGGTMLRVLGEKQKEAAEYGGELMKFRLRVLCGEWGEKYKPGDTVLHKRPNKAHRRASPQELNDSKRTGTFESKYLHMLKYVVDEKGCINVPFESAGYFLTQFGISCNSNIPITNKQEFSKEPHSVGGDVKGKRHIHYWRFKEVTPEQYKNLPVLKEGK